MNDNDYIPDFSDEQNDLLSDEESYLSENSLIELEDTDNYSSQRTFTFDEIREIVNENNSNVGKNS